MRFFSITSDFQQKWEKMRSTKKIFFPLIYQNFFHFLLFYYMVMAKIRGGDALFDVHNVNKLFINVVVQAPLSYNVWVTNKALQNSAGVRRYSALSQVNCESIVS